MSDTNKIKGYIFDDNNQLVVVDNIEIFVTELKDELLIKTFGVTLYNHNLITIQEELVNNGLMKRLKGQSYDSGPTEEALVCMMQEIKHRFEDEEENYYNDVVLDAIDLEPIKRITRYKITFMYELRDRLVQLNLIPKNL